MFKIIHSSLVIYPREDFRHGAHYYRPMFSLFGYIFARRLS